MDTLRHYKKIIFLNTDQEAKVFVGNNQYNSEDDLVIALKPSVKAYLKKRGLPAIDTLLYFTRDSHESALLQSESIVSWIEENSDFTDLGLGVKQAYKDSFVYWMRFSAHYCLWAIEVITNAIKLHEPEVMCASTSDAGIASNLYINENYFGYFARCIAHDKNITFVDTARSTRHGGLCEKARNTRSHARHFIEFLLRWLRFDFSQALILLESLLTQKENIFFTTRLYQMDKLAGELKKNYPNRRFRIVGGPVIFDSGLPGWLITLFAGFRHGRCIIEQKHRFKQLEDKINLEPKIFFYKNVAFNQVIAKKIRTEISTHILGLMIWSVRLSEFINRIRFSAILSNGNRADDIIMAELCKQKGIPAILISHGSHVPLKSKYEEIEWGELAKAFIRGPFSHLALQSPLAEEFLERYPPEGKILRTGPLIWGRPIDKSADKMSMIRVLGGRDNCKDMKVIVHAGTPKAINSLRLYVYETPDEYVQAIRELADIVNNLSGVILIVKFRPFSGIGIEDIKTLIPFSKKVILSVHEPLQTVLSMADLLVSFSSTTIEEALQNRIPVLLYGGAGRYQHIYAFEIQKNIAVPMRPVYHVTNHDDLNYALTRILAFDLNEKKANSGLFTPYIYDNNNRQGVLEGIAVS